MRGTKSQNCRTRRRAATSATSREIPPFKGMFRHRLLHSVREVASLTYTHKCIVNDYLTILNGSLMFKSCVLRECLMTRYGDGVF